MTTNSQSQRITIHLCNGRQAVTDAHDPAEVDTLVRQVHEFWDGQHEHGRITITGTPTIHINLAAVDLVTVEPLTAATPTQSADDSFPRWRDAAGHVWGELEPGRLTGRDSVNVPAHDVANAFGPLERIKDGPQAQ